MASLWAKLGWSSKDADNAREEAHAGNTSKSQTLLKARASFPSLFSSPSKKRLLTQTSDEAVMPLGSLRESLIYPMYDASDPAHNSSLSEGQKRGRNSFSFRGRSSSRSPTKSTRHSTRSLSRTPERSRSRLEGLAKSIRAKAGLFYDPSCAEQEDDISPKSQSSKKSVRFRKRHSTIDAEIEHSSPIPIPTDQLPILPPMNFSNSALIDLDAAPLPSLIQTARPSTPSVLDHALSCTLSEPTNAWLNASPATSSMSNMDCHDLPTPMPGTNLPLDDPFDHADTAANQDHTIHDEIFPRSPSQASLIVHRSKRTSQLQFYEQNGSVNAPKHEDAGYVSDDESDADPVYKGRPRVIEGKSTPSRASSGSSQFAPYALREITNSRKDRYDESRKEGKFGFRRTKHLPHGINGLACHPTLPGPDVLQYGGQTPSERYDADTESVSEFGDKPTLSDKEDGVPLGDDDQSNASTNEDDTGSVLQFKRSEEVDDPSQRVPETIEKIDNPRVGTPMHSSVSRPSRGSGFAPAIHFYDPTFHQTSFAEAERSSESSDSDPVNLTRQIILKRKELRNFCRGRSSTDDTLFSVLESCTSSSGFTMPYVFESSNPHDHEMWTPFSEPRFVDAADNMINNHLADWVARLSTAGFTNLFWMELGLPSATAPGSSSEPLTSDQIEGLTVRVIEISNEQRRQRRYLLSGEAPPSYLQPLYRAPTQPGLPALISNLPPLSIEDDRFRLSNLASQVSAIEYTSALSTQQLDGASTVAQVDSDEDDPTSSHVEDINEPTNIVRYTYFSNGRTCNVHQPDPENNIAISEWVEDINQPDKSVYVEQPANGQTRDLRSAQLRDPMVVESVPAANGGANVTRNENRSSDETTLVSASIVGPSVTGTLIEADVLDSDSIPVKDETSQRDKDAEGSHLGESKSVERLQSEDSTDSDIHGT